MSRSPTIIFDGDSLVYRAGFAAQTTSYQAIFVDPAGELGHGIYPNKTAMIEALKDKTKVAELIESDVLVAVDPVAKALAATKQVLHDTKDILSTHFSVRPGDVDLKIYLSGPDNFRIGLSKIRPYKGHRTAAPPVHYQSIRNYLTQYWDAEVVHGWEADDQCSIEANILREEKARFVVASCDKDLDQITGTHYDYRQHRIYEITPEQAEVFLWTQVLAGDTTDNIQGCHKIGMTKAEKLIGKWNEEGRDLWTATVETFAQTMQSFPEKYPEGMTPHEAALETARLVKLMDYPGQLWVPNGVDESL